MNFQVTFSNMECTECECVWGQKEGELLKVSHFLSVLGFGGGDGGRLLQFKWVSEKLRTGGNHNKQKIS